MELQRIVVECRAVVGKQCWVSYREGRSWDTLLDCSW
jgi:hypothetical protein